MNKPNEVRTVIRSTKWLYIGIMQDKIIASHTCFGGHMDVNC